MGDVPTWAPALAKPGRIPQKAGGNRREDRVRRFWWRCEAALVRGLLALSGWLGPLRASNLGGAVARALGPRLPVSRIGRRNLELAFPGSEAAWRESVLRDAWENLGRTAMEMPHVPRLLRSAEGPGWEITGEENLPRRGAGILLSAHLANWEILLRAAAESGIRMGGFYRAPDNPFVDAIVRRMRQEGADIQLFPKGSKGARLGLRLLADGGVLGLLGDQKLNEGLEVPFLGIPAMTSPAAAELALRFDCPVVLVQVLRIGPCRFRLRVEPPLPMPAEGDRHARLLAITRAMNERIGEWVRERPGEWLWLHRRFPARYYRGEGGARGGAGA